MSDKDYIKCIARTHSDHAGYSWCGKHVKDAFHFINIDHLAENNLIGGRLVGCPDCVDKIVDAIAPSDNQDIGK